MGENPGLIAMARRIAEASRTNGPLGLGHPDAYRAALAAIVETRDCDAALVEAECGETVLGMHLVKSIRSGHHYGKDRPHD